MGHIAPKLIRYNDRTVVVGMSRRPLIPLNALSPFDLDQFHHHTSVLLLRLHLANMPSTKRKENSRRNIKITDLPPEILRRISAFITFDLFVDGPDNLYTALALSRTCTKFYKAVVEANNFRIVLKERYFHHQLAHLKALFSLFRPNVAQIELEYDLDWIPHIRETPFYHNFKFGETMLFGVLVAQTLRTAVIPDKTEYLFAIRHAKSLKNLYIRLYREPSPDIGNTITSLPLRHLAVTNEDYFKQCHGGYPCLINVFRFKGGTPMYRNKCMDLRSMSFSCRCIDHDHYSLTALLEAFPNLRDLHISAYMSPVVAPYFRHLNNIQLEHMENVGDICESLGHAVSAVKSDALLTREEFYQLAHCPRLMALKCRLEYDSEPALIRVARSLTRLRSLQIRWGHTPKPFLSGATPAGCIYSIRPRTVSRLVRAARLLRLEIGSVRMSLKELVEVFKILGCRTLHIVLDRVLIHDETTFRAMITLMDTAAVRNRNLRQLRLNLIPSHNKLGFHEDEGRSRGFLLYQALERTRRLIPWLRWGDLKGSVDDLVNYAYGIKDVIRV